jgi:hypothetical protein
MDKLHNDILKGTQARLKTINELMFRTVTDYYSNNLSIGDDLIKYNQSNIGIIEKLIIELKKLDDPLKRLGTYILKGVRTLLGETAKQLNTVDTRAISQSKPVFDRIMKHAATNVSSNLNLSTAFNEIKEVSMRLMSRPQGIALTELRSVLQERIVDKSISEKYFARWTFDIYNQYQRAGADQVRKKLDLKHALYAGGLIESSRPFCIERNGQVFSEDEIMDWDNEDFEGKPEGYDPIIDCGGYNCRHRLEWISEDMFDELKTEQDG